MVEQAGASAAAGKDKAPFQVPSRKELAEWFGPQEKEATDDAAVIAERAKAYVVYAKQLCVHYTPILVGSGVVEFALGGIQRFALDAPALQQSLHLLSLVSGTSAKNEEAHAQLVLLGAAQAAVTSAKAHPYEADVQRYSLDVVAAVHDDAVRKACCSLGVGRSAVQACNEHRFVPHMSSVRGVRFDWRVSNL